VWFPGTSRRWRAVRGRSLTDISWGSPGLLTRR
jgi:hypothetical protein